MNFLSSSIAVDRCTSSEPMSLQIAVAAPPSGRVKSRVVVAMRLRRATIVSGELMNCWASAILRRIAEQREGLLLREF